jgi:hypothetical protein
MFDAMFQHQNFDKYTFEDVPLNRDLYLVDECYLQEYEKMMLKFFDGDEYQYIGYISFVAARKINENSIELSWYANTSERFHEISITLLRDQFVVCVGSWRCDEKPRIFVKSQWLENIYLRSYSVFALIDAVGVKDALESGEITRDKLIKLRTEIDTLSAKHPNISFISFADSLLLKSNWSVGFFKRSISYSYEPEIFIYLSKEIDAIYKVTLGLSTYAVIAQGSNEYYEDSLLHISKAKNHISLNSLGAPFAQLMEIEKTARSSIRSKSHSPAELYMDEQYYHSLKYKHGFDKNAGANNVYQSKMTGSPCKYYYSSVSNILSNLESV